MDFRELEKSIGYKFKNYKLLEESITHKSINSKLNYERLEFLGDRVLGLIISKELLDKYPYEKEGIIDKKYANLVNKKTCTKIASLLNLKRFIYLGASHKNFSRTADKIISDSAKIF